MWLQGVIEKIDAMAFLDGVENLPHLTLSQKPIGDFDSVRGTRGIVVGYGQLPLQIYLQSELQEKFSKIERRALGRRLIWWLGSRAIPL